MDKPNYYAIIPASVRYDKDLSPTAKLFFGEITSLANATGICFAGNDYFSKIYNISERQVKRIIKQLEEKGYIYVTRNTQSREIQLAERVTKMSLEGDKNVTQKGDKNVTHNNTSINNKYNNIYSPKFEEWYSKYPNKFNKKQTYKNYTKCCKEYTDKQLMQSLDNYIDHIKQNAVDERYIVRSTNFVGNKQEFLAWLPEEHIQQPEEKPPEQFRDEITEIISDEWYDE